MAREPNHYGKVARIWRAERGIHLKDMAKLCGVTSAYLSAIETGRKRISPDARIFDRLPPRLREAAIEMEIDGCWNRINDLNARLAQSRASVR